MTWERAKDVGARIKNLRDALGLFQEDFGELVGVTGQSVSDYETGRSQPSKSRLERLARRVGIPVTGFQEGGPMPATLLPRPAGPRSAGQAPSLGRLRESEPEGPYVNPRARIHIDPHPRGKWALELLEHRLREIEKEPDRIVTQEQRLELLQLAQWAREGDGAAGGVA